MHRDDVARLAAQLPPAQVEILRACKRGEVARCRRSAVTTVEHGEDFRATAARWRRCQRQVQGLLRKELIRMVGHDSYRRPWEPTELGEQVLETLTASTAAPRGER